jgi:cytochrome c biogenesis protein CcdA
LDFIFAYIAGLLTLINPCVLPVLPIALASSLSRHPLGPLALAAGMSLAFTTLGVGLASLGPSLGISIDMISQVGAVLMIVFGAVLLVPRLNETFATATAGFSARADLGMNRVNGDSLAGQALGGVLLGAVWSPCIGPTLGGAISLASQGESLAWADGVMLCFSLGISSVMVALAYGAREAIRRRQDSLRRLSSIAKPAMGAVFLTVGLMILFKVHYVLETALLDAMPVWLQDLSVAF